MIVVDAAGWFLTVIANVVRALPGVEHDLTGPVPVDRLVEPHGLALLERA